MPHPSCPNCKERMSSVEHGLAGVWSCLYCEGCWLSKAELANAASPGLPLNAQVASPVGVQNNELVCPACASASFHSFPVAGSTMHRCIGCESVFLGKAALAQVAPDLTRPGRDLPTTLGHILGGYALGETSLTLGFWLFS